MKSAPAKLSRPRLSGAIPRERLFHLLDKATQLPAVIITGPPGSGKTTLVASYLDARRLNATWYHIDSGDADPATFFYYLGQADRFQSRKTQPLPLLTPEYLSDLQGFTRRFFRLLFDRMPKPSLFVFDNYQDVRAEGAIHEILSTAISEAPDNVTIVLVSREDLPASYARLGANEQLATIAWNELQLTLEETQAIAGGKLGLDVASARMIHKQSGGWAAGVTLMADRLKRQGAANEALSLHTREAVFDYFTSEVLGRLTPAEQKVLLYTALLPTVTAATAELLTGDPQCRHLLELLYKRRLFTERRSAAEPRYRYHDLFREFLLKRLRATTGETAYGAIAGKAARLCRDAGHSEDAFSLLLQSGEWDEAATLIAEQGRLLLRQGRFKTLREWLQGLPGQRVSNEPWLQYWLGLASMPADLPAARTIFERCYDQFAASGDRLGQALASAEVIRCYYYEYGEFCPMGPWVERIDRLLLEGVTFPDATAEVQVYSVLVLGVGWREAGHVREAQFVSRALRLLDADIEINDKVSLGFGLFDYYCMGSRMAAAQAVIDRVAPVIDASEVTALNRAYWYLQLGYYHFRDAQAAEAEKAWAELDRITSEHGLRQTDFVARVFRAFNSSSWFDVVAADRALAGLEVMVATEGPMLGALYHLGRCWVELARRDNAEAARQARLAVEYGDKVDVPFVVVVWRAHGAPALSLAGYHDEAMAWIDKAWACSGGSWVESYRTNLLMARAFDLILRGERERGHDVLREMLALARQNDWWTYLRVCPGIKDVVLTEALVAGIEVPFVQKVVRAFHMRPGPDAPENWPWPVRIQTLGEFVVLRDGTSLEFGRKAQRRPLDLLKVLIGLGGRGVDVGVLAEAMWPESEADDAQDALTMTIHRLRKLLGHEAALEVRDGKCSLDPGLVWIDAWALDRQLDRLESSQNLADLQAGVREVRRLYQGHFLEREGSQAWVLPMQERLRRRVQRLYLSAGTALEHARQWESAADYYEQGLGFDPLAEKFYQRLMICHRECGRMAAATEVYRRCRQMLSVVLGREPSPETSDLFRSLEA